VTPWFLAGAVICVFAAWVLGFIGGPFRPIANEVEQIGQRALCSLAGLLLMLALVVP